MAELPSSKVALGATIGVFALFGAVLSGPAPIAEASVPIADSASAHVATFQDVHDVQDPDPDPAPLIQDPPGVHAPANPGQKTLSPSQHRSHHRAPY
jgi:hypothetical protein